MKNILFSWLVIFLITGNLLNAQSTTMLDFRVTNPRILYDYNNTFGDNCENLMFDIEVKANANSRYFALEVHLTNNSSAFTDMDWLNGILVLTAYYTPTFNTVNDNINLSIASNQAINSSNTTRFAQITTNWQTLGTVVLRIIDISAVQNCTWLPSLMLNNQFEKTFSPNSVQDYLGFNTHGIPISNLYTGRIFSNNSWTQVGGVAVQVPFIDWSNAVNTSVWDTTTTAAVAGVGAMINNLRIHSGSRLIVNPTGTLNVSGAIDNLAGNNGLVLKSDATGTASLLTSASAVPATVERYLTKDLWHLISSPVSGQSIPSMVSSSPFAQNGTKYGLAPYDNSIPNWVPYTTTSVGTAGNFVQAKGYEAMLTANFPLNFKGTLATANTTAAIQISANDWNLIGNPFSSAIYANSPADAVNNFITVNAGIFPDDLPHGHSHTAIYIWNPSTSAFMAVNHASPATYLPVGQGFFVKSKLNGTASFTTVMRTHSTAPFYKNTQSIWPSIELKAQIDGKNKETQIYYIPGMTASVDNGYDAGMFTGETNDYALYTKIAENEVDFAIQSLPDTDFENQVIPVGLNAPQASVVTFTADAMNLPGNMKVFLEDKQKGIFVRIDEAGSSYTVVLNSASSGAGRFYLHTSQLFLGVDNPAADLYAVSAFPAENKIRIHGKITPNTTASIYNLSGQKLGNYSLTAGTENEIPFAYNTNGIYILKIQNGSTIINKKFNWVY